MPDRVRDQAENARRLALDLVRAVAAHARHDLHDVRVAARHLDNRLVLEQRQQRVGRHLANAGVQLLDLADLAEAAQDAAATESGRIVRVEREQRGLTW